MPFINDSCRAVRRCVYSTGGSYRAETVFFKITNGYSRFLSRFNFKIPVSGCLVYFYIRIFIITEIIKAQVESMIKKKFFIDLPVSEKILWIPAEKPYIIFR